MSRIIVKVHVFIDIFTIIHFIHYSGGRIRLQINFSSEKFFAGRPSWYSSPKFAAHRCGLRILTSCMQMRDSALKIAQTKTPHKEVFLFRNSPGRTRTCIPGYGLRVLRSNMLAIPVESITFNPSR